MSTTFKDFERLIELQQVFAQADAQFDDIQLNADRALQATIDRAKAPFAAAKTIRDEAEAAIKELVRAHPEWLDGRNIKTPFGAIEFRKSTKIDVPNPEATIALIDAIYGKPGAKHRPDELTRTVREPNLDMLSLLDDVELAKVGAARKETESVTVKRAKVDLGKKGKAPKETTAAAGGSEVVA